MPARLLIIGLDGGSLDLIRPWADRLPNLNELLETGAWGTLKSTVPPATFPAWTSLMTGVNPGKHGIYDFTRRIPGTYQIEFINATYRRRPSLWHQLSRMGRRVGVIGLPATYPPEEVNGFLISGFDSPVTTGIDSSFVYPPELYREIQQTVGSYEITDFQELRIGPGWHEMALDKLLHAAGRRTEIAAVLMDREAWDCFFVHYGESDTIAHHFWAFHDAASPRHDKGKAERWGDGILGIYQALDRAVGQLLDRAGDDSTVMIVSDHGSGGAGDKVLYLNRWLAEQGWLEFAPASAGGRAAAELKRLGLALPVPIQEWAFRGPLRRMTGRLESSARLGGIDWARTQAFSEEVNTFPSIWLNVRGREPEGIVVPGSEYEGLRDEIMAQLGEWRNPDTGRRLMGRIWRREELYQGPTVEYAPDIVLEPALDQGYSVTCLSSRGEPGAPIRRLAAAEGMGAKGGSMNGSHRPDGLVILAGAGIRPGVRLEAARIVDVTPTVLCLLGESPPEGLDGRVLSEALVEGDRECSSSVMESGQTPLRPYDAVEVGIVRDRLRGLGYRA